MNGANLSNRLAMVGRALAVFGGVALLAACASTGLSSTTAASLNSELHHGYTLAAGDSVRVNVFDEENLTGEYEIGLDGALSIPLIEPIAVDGKSSDAVAEIIADRLKRGGYVLTPKVSVEILQHRPFYILGEVQKPGQYQYNGDMTLAQAVAMAGGFTPRANKRSIILQRQNWSASKRVKLDGTALKIAPGDTITVQEAFF